MTLLRGLPPIFDAQARVIILGSFPSPASLAAGQYYAHKQNQFWRILAAVLDAPLVEMDYAGKLAAVKAAGIAIWDVYAECERAGALDSAIRNGVANDFAVLKKSAVAVRLVCFNGQAAAKFAPQLQAMGYETVVLPSTSPAYTLALDAKLARWRLGLRA